MSPAANAADDRRSAHREEARCADHRDARRRRPAWGL